MAIDLLDSQRRLGLKIRRHREAIDLKQDEFADRAHLSTGYVSQIENGRRNLTFGAMLQIADVLAIRLSELVKDVD